jgi:tight adherence protein C
MTTEALMILIVFVMASSGVLFVFTLVSSKRTRLDDRLEDLEGPATPSSGVFMSSDSSDSPGSRASPANQFTGSALPKLGTALMPSDERERTLLKTRLIQAGLYGRHSLGIFLGVKLLLMVAPAVVGLILGVIGLLPLNAGVLGGACFGIGGLIGPGFWLDGRKKKRQINLRRALPDALDLLVICLEGGLSLPGSLRRVASELRTAHSLLAFELNIAQREIQLGTTPGESLQRLGVRADLEEIRSLASVVTQAEKFGASLVKSLRVHAENLRIKRQQQAEEMAMKASVKVLFPTLLFIFPAVFVVILGPAVFQILESLGNLASK